MQRNVEPSDIFLQAFNSVIRNVTGSCSQCFEAPTALSLSLMLFFSELMWNLSIRSKATCAKSVLMAASHRIR